jgi:hypothetical protein
MEISPDQLQQVIAFWQPFYGDRALTENDAREIVEAVGAVFTILNDWDSREKPTKKDHNDAERRRDSCLS